MLTHLHIKNYALIESLSIEFAPTLNIISGETGAGKSILIGALGLVLANRADASVIRQGEHKCVVEAIFNLKGATLVKQLMQEYELDEAEEITIRREINQVGKSRAFINDTPVNLQVLKQITTYLVDFNGQDEDQQLMHPAEQLRMLDIYGGMAQEREKFKLLYDKILILEQEIDNRKKEAVQNRQNIDFLTFQLDEFVNAHLSVEELPRIESELETLENAGKIAEAINFATQNLYENEESASFVVRTCQQRLDKISQYNAIIQEGVTELTSIRYALEEVNTKLRTFLDSLEPDAKRQEFLNKRIDSYYTLMRKYNVATIEELIDKQNQLQIQLDAILNFDEQIEGLLKEKEVLCAQASVLAELLYQKRKKSAEKLSKEIEDNLKKVGISSPKLVVQSYINQQPDGWVVLEGKSYKPQPYGIDSVIFLLSTNIGIQPGPIHKIASGGEIARVMLALKASLADKMHLPTLIFDEIDSGVSGEVALKVGKLLENISAKHQILSITHLAQVASRGEHHFFVYKDNKNKQPTTKIRKLTYEERVAEIAKIIAGSQITESARQNAIELLKG